MSRRTSSRLLIVTDAWAPQTNGVVTTLNAVVDRLPGLGIEAAVIHPGMFRSVGLPGYREIPLALDLWRLPRNRAYISGGCLE